MGGLFLLLIVLQYALSVAWLARRRYDYFILLQLYAIFGYDYVFIHASFYLPPLLVAALKPYTEYLIVYWLAHFARTQMKQRRSFLSVISAPTMYLLWLPTLAVLLLNDFRHISLFETFKGIRLYLFPVLLPYLMYSCGAFRNCRPRKIINALFLACLLLGMYALYQRATFTGHVRSLWFYRFFDTFPINPVAYQPSNFIRNGALRTTGFFVSPIPYAILYTAPVLLIAAYFIYGVKQTPRAVQAGMAALGILFLCFQWMSSTRAGIIADAIGIAVIAALKLRARFWMVLAIPLAAVGVTFYTLMSGITREESAVGRLAQFRTFAHHFTVSGLGFNSPLVQTHFDSYFISLGLLYGALMSFPLVWMYWLNRQAYSALQKERTYFHAAILAFSLSFIYTFTFQFVAGSAPYRLYFLLLFLIFTNDRFSAGTAAQRYRGGAVSNGDRGG